MTREGVPGTTFLKSINISFVLATLILIKDEEHQSVNSLTTGPWSGSLLVSKDTITESSANFKMWRPACWLRHSFVYRTNSKGERTQPWGDPVEETRVSDRTPLTLTRCGLSVKKSISQAIRPGSTLWKSLNLPAKICGWMLLKADEKSMNKRWAKDLAPSRWFKTRFKRVAKASSTPLPDL